MIIKSHIRGGFRAAAAYLQDIGRNETTRCVEISDPYASTLDEAFEAMRAVARHCRATKPLHHVSINPRKDERLSDEQVRRICARLEEKFKYKPGEHQRVIIEHIKDGRQHFHVVWNRVSLRTGRPVWPGHHWNKSKQAAREMETELGLIRPTPRRTRSNTARTPGLRASGIGHAGTSRRTSTNGSRLLATFKNAHRALTMRFPPASLMRVARNLANRKVRDVPPPMLPIRKRRQRTDAHGRQLDQSVPTDQHTPRDELIAWAWQNGRTDILALFGIYVDFDML